MKHLFTTPINDYSDFTYGGLLICVVIALAIFGFAFFFAKRHIKKLKANQVA